MKKFFKKVRLEIKSINWLKKDEVLTKGSIYLLVVFCFFGFISFFDFFLEKSIMFFIN